MCINNLFGFTTVPHVNSCWTGRVCCIFFICSLHSSEDWLCDVRAPRCQLYHMLYERYEKHDVSLCLLVCIRNGEKKWTLIPWLNVVQTCLFRALHWHYEMSCFPSTIWLLCWASSMWVCDEYSADDVQVWLINYSPWQPHPSGKQIYSCLFGAPLDRTNRWWWGIMQ